MLLSGFNFYNGHVLLFCLKTLIKTVNSGVTNMASYKTSRISHLNNRLFPGLILFKRWKCLYLRH